MKLRFLYTALFAASLAAAADRCEDFSVFFKVRGGSHCKDYWGHVAAAVGNDAFDFGLQKPSWHGKLLGDKGGRFWSKEYGNPQVRALGTREMRGWLSHHHCPIYEFRTQVTPEQGKRFRDFWAKFYQNDPQYWFFGKQCATSVSRALIHSEIIPRQTISILPFTLLAVVERDLVATCGANAGAHPRAKLLNPQAYE